MAHYVFAAALLAATGLFAGTAMSQLRTQVDKVKAPKSTPTPSPSPTAQKARPPEAVKPRREPKPPKSSPKAVDPAERDFARIRDCEKLDQFQRKDKSGSFAERIAEKRRTLRCATPRPAPTASPRPTPTPTPTLSPRPSPSPTHIRVDGAPDIGGTSQVEFMIGKRVIRLAGVVGCNPENDRTELNRRLTGVVSCRPLGADYQCFTRDSREDIARVAVLNGNAQPTGESYENEYYSWRERVTRDKRGKLCLPGR